MYNCIICRYHEIATKGNNRGMFERCLVENIRHLLKSSEMLSQRLLVLHNLWFYNHLMEDIRKALDEGRFAQFKAEQEKILGNRI